MQGFNKYYPPDFDPEKHSSLNSYRGKHALGDRARKIDQGILITRFELPYNIWCGTCNNHIGMGVRYNAEKRKVGMYYSTPIYAFRCKCHLCDGWFEIRTDPKNTRYVVESGARQQEVDWDPEEHGGFRVHDTTQADASTVDPLVALEKTTEALKRLNQVERPRIESLQMVSDHYNNDPYSLSLRARRKFREEKRVEKALKAKDDEVKQRYGLPDTLCLVRDDTQLQDEAKEEFRNARQKLQLGNGRGNTRPAMSAKAALAASLIRTSESRRRDTLNSSSNNYHHRTMSTKESNIGVSIRK